MLFDLPELFFGIALALGAGAQILALTLPRPGRLVRFSAMASMPPVLLYALRDRDVTLLIGQLCVFLLLCFRGRS